jgi:protein-L-isoaspartate(D-aspartate) O-methyltransferase
MKAMLSNALVIFCLAAAIGAAAAQEDEHAARRRDMVAQIAAMTDLTFGDTGKTIFDAKVMAAMAKVPRHRLVPAEQQRHAYQNRPLPIGYGQTISQPYIVALMTDLLQVKSGDTVLEVGTGSGYQAAILAELAASVATIEIIAPLGDLARERLRELGYRNVEVRVGDGYYGWEERAPFDAIVVTAAASHIPPPLIKQLKPGGRMVIPVGAQFMVQHLMLVEKKPDGSLISRQLTPVRFVPLTGGH